MMVLSKLSERGNETTVSIVKEIAKEFQDLFETRNRLIHASWGIGRWLSEQDISTLVVEKYQVTKDEFKREMTYQGRSMNCWFWERKPKKYGGNWVGSFNIFNIVRRESNTFSLMRVGSGYLLPQRLSAPQKPKSSPRKLR